MRRLSVLIIYFSLFVNFVIAQNETFSFKHLTNDDGLSNASIIKIMQDSKGFMWFSTINGLNKFDGYNFTVYKNIPSDSTSLSDNRVEFIFEDSDGDIWVSTANGLNLYNRKLDNFTQIHADPNSKAGLLNNYVSEIDEINGEIWVLTHGGGINKYNKQTKAFTYLKHYPGNPHSLASNTVWSINQDSRNNIWIGSNYGVDCYNCKTKKFKHYRFEADNPSINNVRCVFELKKNDYLVGTDAGLIRLFTKTDKEFEYYRYKYDPKDENSLHYQQVRDVFQDSSGRIWIASQNGLYIYNKEDNNFSKIERKVNNISSLSCNEIWDIEEDNQGNLWFGGYKGGLNILNTKQKFFKNRNFNPEDPKSLVNNSVLCFEENNDGTIWVGIDHGGLSLFDKNKGTIKNYKNSRTKAHSISSNAVLCLFRDSENNLWIGTWAGGMNKFNEKTETFEHFSPPEIPIIDWHVWDIEEDKNGLIWGASHLGVSSYNPITEKYRTYFNSSSNPNSISHNYNWAVFNDSKDNLWFGTTKGLSKYNKETDDFTFFPYKTKNGKNINSSTIYVIKEDKQKRLWLGASETGLNLFNSETGVFKAFNQYDELSKTEIYAIEFDDNNNLWLSTSNGLVKATLNENNEVTEVFNFDNSNGIKAGEFNIGASLKSKTGELFFGGSKGFVFFNPDSIKPNSFKPEVYITGFRIFNEPVPINRNGKTDSPLNQHISESKEIILNHKQSIFSLTFSALSYTAPSKNQYAYKLDGLEEKWNYVKNKRDATYTNLNPGEYTFMVKASNNDGLWSDKITTLKIIILPPWWRTLWAKLIAILVVILLLVSFYFYRVNSLKEQQKKLEKEVAQRTKQLKKSNLILHDKQEEVLLQNEEIKAKNEQLECQKEKIEEINTKLKDSILKLKKSFEEQKEMERKLIQSNKMASLGLLSAGIAHEINNPINFVYAGINSLMRDFEDIKPIIEEVSKLNPNSDNLKDALAKIEKMKKEYYFDEAFEAIPQIIKDIKLGADRTAEIVKGLRTFSRTEVGSMQDLDVNKGVDTALLLLRNKYKNHVEIIKNYDENIPLYKCYSSKINQVFLNIIANAIDAIKEKGRIWINTKFENDTIVISIKDSGHGMRRDVSDKIFDPFFTTKSVGKGTGLGLSITYGTINEHKGNIQVLSEEGKGTEFVISLPLKFEK